MSPATAPSVSPSAEREPLLAIDDLTVDFAAATGPTRVIDGVSLTVSRGEIVALVGESGSGKSLTALSILRLLPPGGRIVRGRVKLGAEMLTDLTPQQMNRVRGRQVGMVFQQPQSMLDPTCRIGVQVAESLRIHGGVDRRRAEARVLELFGELRIPDPQARAEGYAYALSGGMAQRVMLAAALIADPPLLIADEPTTALDVTVQAEILRLLMEQRRRRGMAILLITHDLSIVAAVADRVAVMYAGRIVEEGSARRILAAPRHPYTRALVAGSVLETDAAGALVAIPSGAIAARDIASGCRFHPRCGICQDGAHASHCVAQEPALAELGDGSRLRCWAAPPFTGPV